MRFQIQLHQLRQRLRIMRRERKLQMARVRRTILEFQLQADFRGRARVRSQASTQLVQQARSQEQQRLEQRDRMIGLQPLLIADPFAHRPQRPLRFSPRDLQQFQAAQAKALDDARFGELGKVLNRADAPAIQHLDCFEIVRRLEQRLDRKARQMPALLASGNQVERACMPRGEDRHLRIGRDADLTLDAPFMSAPGDFAGDFLGSTDEADQRADGKDDGGRVSGLLHFGGERFTEREQGRRFAAGVIRDVDSRVHCRFRLGHVTTKTPESGYM